MKAQDKTVLLGRLGAILERTSDSADRTALNHAIALIERYVMPVEEHEPHKRAIATGQIETLGEIDSALDDLAADSPPLQDLIARRDYIVSQIAAQAGWD